MDKRHWEHGPCPKHDCRKDSCKCGLRLISFPAALGDDSKGSPVAPKNGDYCNALVKYESNGHMYVYSTEGVPERLSSNGTLNFEELLNRPQYDGETMTGETNIPKVPSAVSQLTNDLDFQTEEEVDSTVASAVAIETAARQQADNTLQSAINGVSNDLGAETTARRNADNNLQSQIDGISASSDVKDIVGTYAELQAYDTSTLGNNDIIKVLQDEAHLDETTYYRWSTTTQTFTLIGEEGPYYTKAATDALLAGKQDTLTIAQAPGQSTTSVMSQKATTEMVFDKFGEGVNINPADSGISQDPEFKYLINIGQDTNHSSGSGGMVLVGGQSTGGQYSTTIGFHTQGLDGSTLIGSFSADETVLPVQDETVSFGSDHAQVFMNEYGAQSTKPAFTRRLINVSTPVKNTDAATKDYVDDLLSGKQDTLTAGSNISISGSTISATNTTYTAGDGLSLTGTVFSINIDVVATKGDLADMLELLMFYITDAREYSASATYAVGDYAIHNGVIYQCNTAIVGGEAWNASHWDAVPSLQEQLDNTETWTFELEGGTTVTKKVVIR